MTRANFVPAPGGREAMKKLYVDCEMSDGSKGRVYFVDEAEMDDFVKRNTSRCVRLNPCGELGKKAR